MPPTTNIAMRRSREPSARASVTTVIRSLLASVVLVACGSSGATPSADSGACVPPAPGAAPTYTELFTKYFAPGTPGHCATAGCHADPDHNIWLCGTSKETCYAGMVGQGLIDPMDPKASLIGDTRNSPISWINPNGPMPFDQPSPPVPFPEGRAAILAWLAACAQNN